MSLQNIIMGNRKEILSRINSAANAIAKAVADAEAGCRTQIHVISEALRAEETAIDDQLAVIQKEHLRSENEAKHNKGLQLSCIIEERDNLLMKLRTESYEIQERLQHNHEKAMEEVHAALEQVEQQAEEWGRPWPSLSPYSPAESMPGLLRFGMLTITSARNKIVTPAFLPFPGNKNIIITAAGAEVKNKAVQTLQSVILRLLHFCPPAKLRLMLIDPVGLGHNLAPFLPHGDAVDGGNCSGQQGVAVSADQFVQQMVSGKVWVESGDIEKRLAEMSAHLEIVVQKYLRSKYQTMEEYNRQAGEVEEPYRLLLVVNFPVNFTDQAAKRLSSIAVNGPRCGIYSVITWDTEQKNPHGFNPADLLSTADVIHWDGAHFIWQDSPYAEAALELDTSPDSATFESMVQTVWKHARRASRIVLPFSKIVSTKENFWDDGKTIFGLKVPIGQAGAEGRQLFEIGQGTAIHALLTGQTGSGKSNLLHILICSLAVAYSPDELELYLVDFKKGVEFKIYAPSDDGLGALPHARVIAIESEREFGLSCLAALSAEMDRRGDLFREAGCQNITEYRQKDPTRKMPRILLLVDEFQVFFEEDDRISDQAKQYLDRLVSQSRASGIHIILASQTLERAKTLSSSTMSQMAVRIALKASTEQDSIKMIGNKDAYSLLERQGEAFYNSANGLPQSNARFQIPYMQEAERDALLQSLKERQQNVNEVIVFEGNQPAQLEEIPYWRGQFALDSWPVRSRALSVPLGLPVAIKSPTAARFYHHPGRNLLVVGRDEKAGAGILSAVLLGLASQLPPKQARFCLWNFNHHESPFVDLPDILANSLSSYDVQMGKSREVLKMIQDVAAIVAQRVAEKNTGQEEIFIVGFGLQRCRDLIPEPTHRITVGSEAQREAPGNLFARILREGSEVGVYVIGWWDTNLTLSKAVDRTLLREFGMRAVMNMSREDSRNLIDEVDAAKLGQHRALFWDEEEVGKLEKFIPYAPATKEWIDTFGRSLGRRRV